MKAFKTASVGFTDSKRVWHWCTFSIYNGDIVLFANSDTGIQKPEMNKEFYEMAQAARKILFPA